MDIDFLDEPKILHPGQGQPAFLDQFAKAQWIIRPRICLADALAKQGSTPTNAGAVLCQHPNGGRFVQVSATWLCEAFGRDADTIWRANLTGDLRLNVTPLDPGQPGSRLKLEFSLEDHTVCVEVRTALRPG
jgi:hypothetical protein